MTTRLKKWRFRRQLHVAVTSTRERLKMKYLLAGLRRCFRDNEKPPVECPVKNKEENQEINQRVVELPEEIIVEILLKLPFKNMIQFCCVSKKWQSLILHDPQFSKTHYKVASQQRTLGQSLLVSSQLILPSTHYAYELSNANFQSLQSLAGDQHVPNYSFISSPFKENHPDSCWHSTAQLLGSCNGLVCLSRGFITRRQYFKNVHIWNPSTGFVRNLQELARELPNLLLQQLEDGIIRYAHTGFGYVNATDDYKYVVLASELKAKRVTAAIFSLRTKCWKCIEAPSNICQWLNNAYPGIYLNEALHWITLDFEEEKTTITTVDLGKEEFREMPLLPDSMNTDSTAHDQNAVEVLVRLGDCLGLWRSNSRDFQLWVMREYNVHKSWNLLYYFKTADLPTNVANLTLRPALVTDSGTFVLKVSDYKKISLIRIECREEKKPVCSYQHIYEESDTAFWGCDAIQYDQTLLSAS